MIGPYIRLYILSTSGDHGDGLRCAGCKKDREECGEDKTGISAAMRSEVYGISPYPSMWTLGREIWPAVSLDASAVTQQSATDRGRCLFAAQTRDRLARRRRSTALLPDGGEAGAAEL
jgi:hypothetical protein